MCFSDGFLKSFCKHFQFVRPLPPRRGLSGRRGLGQRLEGPRGGGDGRTNKTFLQLKILAPEILVRNWPERNPNGPRTNPERTPNGLRTDPEQKVREIKRYVTGPGENVSET